MDEEMNSSLHSGDPPHRRSGRARSSREGSDVSELFRRRKSNAGRLRAAGGSDARRGGGHSDGDGADHVMGGIANEALEAPPLKPVRAPRDQFAYEEDEEEGGGCSRAECIGCCYATPGGRGGASGESDEQDAFRQMHDLIITHHNNKCSDRQLVDMVHEFYEREIRPWSDRLGEWPKKSIYEHIYYHMNDPDIQTAGLASVLYAQVQSLREVCWQKNADTGAVTPHVSNIKLLADLVTKQQALVETRRRRATGTSGR